MSTIVEAAVKSFFQKAIESPEQTFSLSLGEGIIIGEQTREWIIAECPKNVQLAQDILEAPRG